MLASQLEPYLLPLQSVWDSNWGIWIHKLQLWWQTDYRGFWILKFRTTGETQYGENVKKTFLLLLRLFHLSCELWPSITSLPAPDRKLRGQGLPQDQTSSQTWARPGSGKEEAEGRDVSIPSSCGLVKTPQTFHSHHSSWQLQLRFQFLGKLSIYSSL